METTYNNIIKAFEYYASQHKQINTFHCGKLYNLETTSVQYPAMVIMPQPSTVTERTVLMTFNVFFMDLLNRDSSNVNEIHSDQLLLLLDFFKYLEYGTDLFLIVPESKTIESFTETGTDILAGWQGSFTVEYAIGDHCDIPWKTAEPEPEPEPEPEQQRVVSFSFANIEEEILIENINDGDGSLISNFQQAFYQCDFEVTPAFNLIGSTNNMNMFYENPRLHKSILTNINASISFYGCNLNHVAILDIFQNQLLDVAATQTIDLRRNPDVANLPAATIAVATAKNWTVQIV